MIICISEDAIVATPKNKGELSIYANFLYLVGDTK